MGVTAIFHSRNRKIEKTKLERSRIEKRGGKDGKGRKRIRKKRRRKRRRRKERKRRKETAVMTTNKKWPKHTRQVLVPVPVTSV